MTEPFRSPWAIGVVIVVTACVAALYTTFDLSRAAGWLLAGGFGVLLVAAVVWQRQQVAWAQHRRAEDRVRSHDLFQALLEGIDVGIAVQDRAGALIYANQTAATVSGYRSPDELLAAPAREIVERFEVFGIDGAPVALEDLPSQVALRGETAPEVALRFRMRGSSVDRWSLIRAMPTFDAPGRVRYAITFFREVTAQTRADEQRAFLLRATAELNSSLDYEETLGRVTRMAVPVLADWCAIDLVADGGVKRVATAHVDPSKLALVDELERRYPSDPDARHGVPQVIRSGRPELISELPREVLLAGAVDAEHAALLARLELRSYLSVPLTVAGKTIGALTFAMAESKRNHTERDLEFASALADRAALAIENARLYGELAHANAVVAAQLVDETQRRREAENTSRFAETFIGILGHDLRNPLHSIVMGAELMKQKATGDPRLLDRVLASGQRMSNMVSQLLDLTRSRLAGGIPVDCRPIELDAVISSVLDELALAHPDREILWDRQPARGAWDPDRLAQVMSNLAGNALQHGDPLRPVSVQLVVHLANVQLVVHNYGRAIPDALLPIIFDPYKRAGVRDARSTGLGLGLFISQQIVHAHGGTIEVASTVDDGTTFRVALPRRHPLSVDAPPVPT